MHKAEAYVSSWSNVEEHAASGSASTFLTSALQTGPSAFGQSEPIVAEAVWKRNWLGKAAGLRDVTSPPMHLAAGSQAQIASINGLTPRIAMTRFML